MTRQNGTNNLYSTLMRTKSIQSKNHYVSSSNKSSNTDLNKLSKMNLTAKHSVNTSLDLPEKCNNKNKLVEILKKENLEFSLKIKEQQKTINEILNQKKTLEGKYLSLEKKKRVLIDEIDSLKANENQLITVLFVLEENGIPIEQIIDKWNAENEPSNRSLDSAAFTPITLEKQPKYLTKIENIPKLNFSSIKATSFRKKINNKITNEHFNHNHINCYENNDIDYKKKKKRCYSQQWNDEEEKRRQKINEEEVKNN